MNVIDTPIADLKILEPKIFKDDRGYFCETYNQKTHLGLGLKQDWVQDNQSFSSYGTLRGLHFQKGESAQAKLVRVIEGVVLDVAVDLRPTSDTFGKHFSVELSGENHKQFLIPRGFAHGFVVLSPTALFAYKCDNFYNPSAEGGIIYNDSHLAIDWRIPEGDVIMSEKDKQLETFKEYREKCY